MRVLAGDIGGTKTSLAVYAIHPDARPTLLHAARYASADHPGLAAVLELLRRDCDLPLDAAAFAVAGPVVAGRCRTTNLPWELDARVLADALAVPVALVNDFHGVARGIAAVAPDDFEILQPGTRDPGGPVAILGAGTGLGEALLVPTPAGPRVLAGEGGHADLAPRDDLEIDLLKFLRKRHGRVSVERVVSGPGLVAIHDFLLDREPALRDPTIAARMAAEDPAAVITRHAADDDACARAVAIMVGLYGAEAGNLALKSLPTGGLYIAGGVTLHLRPHLRTGFLPAFLAKGRMSALLAAIPVSIVLRDDVGRLGAALVAAELTSRSVRQ